MFCDSSQEQLDEILEYYKNQKDASSQENLVALLREVQDVLNCIPEDIQEEISGMLNIKGSVITRLIKLYPSLTSSPSFHQITLCLGPRCSAKQAQELMNTVKKAIRQKPFRFRSQNCLKQCPTAPNMRIDKDLYTNVSMDEIEDILAKYC